MLSAVTGEGVEAVLRALIAEVQQAREAVADGCAGRGPLAGLAMTLAASNTGASPSRSARRCWSTARAGLKRDWLASLADDIAALSARRRRGPRRLVGRHRARPHHPRPRQQDAEAGGEPGGRRGRPDRAGRRLVGSARGKGLKSGQILLTLGDTEERRRYLNARATISTLLKMKAVPVINENDTVATSEIRYGDNDRLAARVATMMGADLLVLLSDIDGLYTAPPARDPDARFIPLVERITPDIEAMAGAAASELSRGGMRTKLDAGKIATAAGTAMIITLGARDNPAGGDRARRARTPASSRAPIR